MRRFFIPLDQIDDRKVVILGEDHHHLAHVLRAKPGQQIEVTDGRGNILTVSITAIHSDHTELHIESVLSLQERKLSIRLFQALPQREQFESVIKSATELGVNTIYPLYTERSLPRYNEDRTSKKVQRWRRIATETAKRVGRLSLPEVHTPLNFRNISDYLNVESLRLALWELEEQRMIKDVLRETKVIGQCDLVIGCEGGFSLKEIENLRRMGFVTVSLGKRILTVETAVTVTLAIVYYELEP